VVELLSIEDALERVLERAHALEGEPVPIEEAAGRVLAEPALARVDLPPFASSAMDGFAVRANETPGDLPVAFEVAAGRPSGESLPDRSAAVIATGGAVPEGADAVVPVELTVARDGRVEIEVEARPGQHVRPRGGDVRSGEVVVERGVRLTPPQVGALAAAGVAEVACARRPRVSVLATGSELRPPGATLQAGEIFDSNRLMIESVLSPSGATVDLLPVVEDDEEAHRRALEHALGADVLVSSGGVSMGQHDLVRRVEAELGVEEIFWGVAVKPGKPLSFGIRGRTLVFGLPGNPVSSLVGSVLFVRPALLALQGLADPRPRYEHGLTAATLRRNGHRDEFVRARRRFGDAGTFVEPIVGQESHMIVRAASADALVHVPRGEGELAEGSSVRYLALD
jgi:molybdopterin molybdotransferase